MLRGEKQGRMTRRKEGGSKREGGRWRRKKNVRITFFTRRGET
jgi:hypothetical protein